MNDRIFIARGPHCFGIGDDKQTAVLECKWHAPKPGDTYAPEGDEIDVEIFEAHPDSRVSSFDGAITHPEGEPPEKLEEVTLYRKVDPSELEEGDVIDEGQSEHRVVGFFCDERNERRADVEEVDKREDKELTTFEEDEGVWLGGGSVILVHPEYVGQPPSLKRD